MSRSQILKILKNTAKSVVFVAFLVFLPLVLVHSILEVVLEFLEWLVDRIEDGIDRFGERRD
jgi:hypothetical protein